MEKITIDTGWAFLGSGKLLFSNCPKLKTIELCSGPLIGAERNIFDESAYEEAILRVSEDLLLAVQNTDMLPWSLFKHVSVLSGVEEVEIDDMPNKDIYSINGTIIKRNASTNDIWDLPLGIYIVNGKKFIKR